MPRTSRAPVGGYCYHVLNRGNARAEVFHKERDFQAFLDMIAEASLGHPMRILAYCLMPNHFHLVLWPQGDGDLSRWVHWLLTTHVRRYQKHYHSSGHIWQGRFKSFPIQEDDHLRVVLRYVERNPLRAHLVKRAEEWRWSSLHALSSGSPGPIRLDPGPAPRGTGWAEEVNALMLDGDLARVRVSIRRDRPLGDPTWTLATAQGIGPGIQSPSTRSPAPATNRLIEAFAVSFPVLPYREIRRIREPKAKSPIFTIISTKLPVSPLAPPLNYQCPLWLPFLVALEAIAGTILMGFFIWAVTNPPSKCST